VNIFGGFQTPILIMRKEFNWAGNYQYSTNRIYYPKTIEEIQQIVKKTDKIKVLGTRHSFNGIADSTENLISLKEISPSIVVDAVSRSVTVGAGVRYGQLCGQLQSAGFALHNLGSLPHISIAGACVSATHGSGVKNAILATAVSAMEIVKADGEIIVLSRAKDGDKFNGAVVSLGALGVVTQLTLDLQTSFDVKQDVYENLPLKALENNLHDILSLGYSVSLFTDWKTNAINQVWIKSKLQHGAAVDTLVLNGLFGATAATTNLHPIPGMAVENCTEQMGVPGPWHERLPHFRMNFTPR
jgi:alditol oxidase